MAIDSEAKRWSMLRHIAPYATLINPSGSGADSKVERATFLYLYGGIDFGVANGTVVLTGTALTALIESEVIFGGKAIIATISDDTWLSTLGDDNAATTAWLAGLTSDRNGSGEWDAQVRDNLTHANLTRDSSTVVTLVLPATVYDPDGNETITHVIDASTMTLTSGDVTATPTISITASPNPAPGRRTLIIEPHNREVTLEPENRTIVIEPQNRTVLH